MYIPRWWNVLSVRREESAVSLDCQSFLSVAPRRPGDSVGRTSQDWRILHSQYADSQQASRLRSLHNRKYRRRCHTLGRDISHVTQSKDDRDSFLLWNVVLGPAWHLTHRQLILDINQKYSLWNIMGNLFIALLWLTSSLSQGRQNTTVDTVMYHRTCMIYLELYIMCIQKTTRPIVAKEWRMDQLSCFELTLYHWVVRCELLSDHDMVSLESLSQLETKLHSRSTVVLMTIDR